MRSRTSTLAVACAALLTACGGGAELEEVEPALRVDVQPAVLVARQGESVRLRVDVPDVPDGDLPSGYAIDLDEVVGRIDVVTTPCPAGAGSRACEDWTITPRADSIPGRYDVAVRTVGSRVGIGGRGFRLTVVADPSPAHGTAVAVAASLGHALVRNDAGRLFVLGRNRQAEARIGYRRSNNVGAALEIVEPSDVAEFVEAPLPPSSRWSDAAASVAFSSFAVRDDGSVFAWGDNHDGDLGFRSSEGFQADPQPVPGLANARAVASSGSSSLHDSLALLADGSVWRWSQTEAPSPHCEQRGTSVPCERVLAGVRAMAKAPDLSRNIGAFLKNDGSVWFGFGSSVQRVADAPTSVAIALTSDARLAMAAADGSVWVRDIDGGPTRQVAGLSDVTALSTRPSSTRSDLFALRRDGTVWTWLEGAEAPANVPQPIAGLANVVALGANHAITGDCGIGGALWRIDRAGGTQAPRAVRVPGFGEGPGCTPPPTVELAIRVTGQGRIVSAPSGIDCGASCLARFAQGAEVKLHESPAAGWRFERWIGEGCDTTVVPMSNLACEAVFNEGAERRLSVRIEGRGSVASSPAGIDCGDDCQQAYGFETSVRLAATPARGHGFERFAGDADCTDGALTMDAVRNCVAVFAPLAVPPTPSGFGASALGAAAQLRWDAGGNTVERYRLERADGSGVFGVVADAILGSETTFIDRTTAANTAYTYRLIAINSRGESAPAIADVTTLAEAPPVLDVAIAGSGSGRVISVPRGISCGSDCSMSFAPGQGVTLFADGNFSRWEGCDTANGNRCTLTMDRSRRVSALFDAAAAPRFVLTVIKNGTGAVVSTPGGIECGFACVADFAAGTVVTLSGSAQFAGANGCDQIVGLQCTVTMDRSRAVVFGGEAPPPATSFALNLALSGNFGEVHAFIGAPTNGVPALQCINSPGGPNPCTRTFAAGTQLVLVPRSFVGQVVWSGCDRDNGNDGCIVAVNGARSVTARFQ